VYDDGTDTTLTTSDFATITLHGLTAGPTGSFDNIAEINSVSQLFFGYDAIVLT
jgi:hypothetical protein